MFNGTTGNRGARGVGLEAAVVAATAASAVEVDGDVADFAGAIGGTVMELAVQDDPAADPGPDGHADHVRAAACRADPGFAEDGTIGIVVERRHQAEALGQLGPQRHVHPAEIRREQDHPGARVERPRGTDADAEDLGPGHGGLERGKGLAPHLGQILHDRVRAATRIRRPGVIADDSRSIGGDGADDEIGATDVNAENPLHRVVSNGGVGVAAGRCGSGPSGSGPPETTAS